jgi:hypothetical protein
MTMTIHFGPDTRFSTYLKAFFSDMLTGMSGPLSVPFALLALWVSSHTQKLLYASLAVLCALFASYRVWRNERREASARLNNKIAEVNSLTESLTAIQQRSKLRMTITAEGDDRQVLKVVADRPVIVSRLEYMMTSDVVIAAEDVSLEDEAVVEIPIKEELLRKLWNAPRPDRNNFDHSGPAKIGITLACDGQTHELILPILMQFVMRGSTLSQKIIGSKTFQS